MNTKRTIIAISAICFAALALSACQGGAEGTSPKFNATKLASNKVLKKGWVELPVPIHISESVPEKFRAVVLTAIDRWNEQAGTQLLDYQGVVAKARADEDGVNVVTWDVNPSPKGYFGETQKSWVGDGEIVEADVTFFGDPDDFAVLSCEDRKEVCKSADSRKDLMTTALHELGHVLGFVHTDEAGHLMNPGFTFGDVFQHFDDTVVTELKEVYNPTIVAAN